MTSSPSDWGSGERVFGPPAGTLDVDWLVPALLERVPTDPAAARQALRTAWLAHRQRVAGAGSGRPVSTEPVAGQPVATEPVAGQPVATEPVATEPAAGRSGAAELMTDGSLAAVADEIVRAAVEEYRVPPE